jgi:hypothetical protein
MKKLVLICLLLTSIQFSSNAKTIKTTNSSLNYVANEGSPIFLYYEIRLLLDGCFHLVSVYDTYYIINDFRTWAGKTVFGCLTDNDFQNMC